MLIISRFQALFRDCSASVSQAMQVFIRFSHFCEGHDIGKHVGKFSEVCR